MDARPSTLRRAARRGLGLLIALALAGGARAQEAAEFSLHELAPGVYAAIDRDGKAGANAGFVIGAESVAVVDSFFHESAARALLAAIRARTPLPIRYVVSTHHHIDHVGGNALFAEAGATLVAQRRVAGWLRSENLRLLGERLSPALRERIERLPAPQLGYGDAMRLSLGGGRQLLLRHWPGHTGGDTVVSVSDAPVVFMGDLLWRASVPNLIDARPAAWRDTLAALAEDSAVPGRTLRFVPGHGGVASVQDLRDFADYLAELDRAVAEAGSDSERALARLAQRYAGWAYFKGLAAANVRDQQAEREGRKRVPE